MVRRLLSAIALATITLAVSAQVWVGSAGIPAVKNSNQKVFVQKKFKNRLVQQDVQQKGFKMAVAPKAQKAPQFAPMAPEDENTTWWGYPLGNAIYGWGFADIDQAIGAGGLLAKQTAYNVAMYVPNNYAGARIEKLSITFLDPANMSDVKIWFAPLATDNYGYPELPAKAEDASYWFSLPVSEINVPEISGGSYMLSPTEITLPEPFDIPAKGICIGYSFTGKSDDMPIIVGDESQSGGFFFSYDYGGVTWDDFGGYGFGNLTTEAYLNLDNCIKNKVSIGTIGEFTMKSGVEQLISARISNVGPNEISSISYMLTVDGVPGVEMPIRLDEPMASQDYTYLDIPVTVDPGIYEINLKITKVNGEPNALEGVGTVDADGRVVAIANPAERTSVVEETTGTWCQWCPRGHVGMERLKETLGSKVITIASHIGYNSSNPDPMECSSYMDFQKYLSGGSAPSALIDRVAMADPYSGFYQLTSANDYYRFAADKAVELVDSEIPSEASVKLDAEWSDDAKTAIKANVTTTFNVDRKDAPYGLVFVIKEDGMSGTDGSWYQVNAYSKPGHRYTDSDMDFFNTAGNYVKMTYDDVAVAAWDVLQGRANSITAPIKKGEGQNYSMALSIARNTLIQNKDNLTLVAMLVNRNNLRIVNAAQVSMGTTSAIHGVGTGSASLTETARYSVNGTRLTAPQRGLNIVKMNDGSVRKQMVK